jgi:hypothetical protein
MKETNKVARVAASKVIEKTAQNWGRLSTQAKTELKSKLPLDDLYTAIVAACFDMTKYIIGSNDEAAKSAIEEKSKSLQFYQNQVTLEENEDRKSYLYQKIDETSEAMFLIYNQNRKDRNKKYFSLVSAVIVSAAAVVLFPKRRT